MLTRSNFEVQPSHVLAVSRQNQQSTVQTWSTAHPVPSFNANISNVAMHMPHLPSNHSLAGMLPFPMNRCRDASPSWSMGSSVQATFTNMQKIDSKQFSSVDNKASGYPNHSRPERPECYNIVDDDDDIQEIVPFKHAKTANTHSTSSLSALLVITRFLMNFFDNL